MNIDDGDQSGSNGDCENGEEKSESKETTRKIVRVLTVSFSKKKFFFSFTNCRVKI